MGELITGRAVLTKPGLVKVPPVKKIVATYVEINAASGWTHGYSDKIAANSVITGANIRITSQDRVGPYDHRFWLKLDQVTPIVIAGAYLMGDIVEPKAMGILYFWRIWASDLDWRWELRIPVLGPGWRICVIAWTANASLVSFDYSVDVEI